MNKFCIVMMIGFLLFSHQNVFAETHDIREDIFDSVVQDLQSDESFSVNIWSYFEDDGETVTWSLNLDPILRGDVLSDQFDWEYQIIQGTDLFEEQMMFEQQMQEEM